MLAPASRQRLALRRLSAVTEQATTGALLAVRSRSVDDVMDGLLDLLPAVGDEYGLAAGTLAADWYDDLRDEAGASGRFLAEPAAMAGAARYRALVRWGVRPLYGAEQDYDTTASRLAGGMQRIVANGYRDTIRESSIRDRAARGWMRIGGGSTCDFCAMLIGRGAVYTESSASFDSHDRCGCIAAPAFG